VFRFPTGAQDLSLLQAVTPALRSTQPSIHWVPRLKRPGRESDHSRPSSAEIDCMELYLHYPLYLHVLHRDYTLLDVKIVGGQVIA
jgi:hypothetical protein